MKKYLVSIFINFGSILINFFAYIILTQITISILGDYNHGLLNFSISIISFLSLFNFGISSSYLYFFYRSKTNSYDLNLLNSTFFNTFFLISIFSSLFGVIIYFNIESVSNYAFLEIEYVSVRLILLLLIINNFFSLMINPFSSYLIALEKFVFIKISNFFQVLFSFLLSLVFLYSNFGIFSTPFAMLISNFFVFLTFIFYSKMNSFKFTFIKINFTLLKQILAFSSFVFLNMIADQINWNIDKFLITVFRSPNETSYYSVSSLFVTGFITLGTVITSLLLPRINFISSNSTNSNLSDLNSLFIKSSRFQFYLLYFFFLFFLLFGQYFIGFWLSNEYRDSYLVTLLLISPLLVILSQNTAIEILKAKNKHWFRAITYIFVAVLNALISIPLIITFGYLGAAFGTFLSLIIGNIIVINIYYLCVLKLPIVMFWLFILKQIVISLPFILVFVLLNRLLIINYVTFAIMSFGFFIIYLFYLYFFSFNEREKKLFNSFFSFDFT